MLRYNLQGKRPAQAPAILDHQASRMPVTFHKKYLIRDSMHDYPEVQQPASTLKSPARVLLMAQQNDSNWDQNQLNVSLVEIGIDSGEWWWSCYDAGQNECAQSWQIGLISWNADLAMRILKRCWKLRRNIDILVQCLLLWTFQTLRMN
jgi:hypothetical protein